MLQAVTGYHPSLQCANVSYFMHLALLLHIEYAYVCRIPKGFGMVQAITQIAFTILSDSSTGFDEMRRAIILPHKQT